MLGHGLPRQAASCEGGHGGPGRELGELIEGRELGELIEAVVRPLLREQELSISRGVRAMFESYCTASGASASVGAERLAPRGPCRADRFGGLAPYELQVPSSPEPGRPKSPDQRAQGVKSLEDARGREILCGMTRQCSGAVRQCRPEQEPKADDGDLPFSPARSVEDMLGLPSPRPPHARASPRGGGGWPRPSGALHALRRLAPVRARAPPRELLDLCGPVPPGAASPGDDAPPRRLGPRSGSRRDMPVPQRLGRPDLLAGELLLPGERRPVPPGLPGGLGPAEAEKAAPRGAGAGGHVRVHLTREDVVGGASRLGVEALEATAGALRGIRVTAIHEDGLIALWNARQTEGRLRVGDVIVEVNGRTEDLACVLSQAFALGEALDIVVAVPEASAAGDAHPGWAAAVLALPTRPVAEDVAEDDAAGSAELSGWPLSGTDLPGEPTGCGCEAGTGSESTQEGVEPARRMSGSEGGGGPPLQQPDGSDWASHGSSGSGGPPPRPAVGDHCLSDLCERSPEGCPSESLRRLDPVCYNSERSAEGSGCQSESLRRLDPACYISSSSRSMRRKCSKSSLGLPAVQTVQTVRHQREDGLVEAMVQDQDWLISDGAFCILDSPEAEGHVSAPLWLRVCGALPWGRSGALRSSCRPLVLASMGLILCFLVFTAAYAPAGSCERTACLSYVQVADLALVVGSLLGLLAMQSLSSLGILGNSESILVAYARRQEITAAWSAAMRGHTARLALLWVCSVALRLASLMRGPRPSLLDAAMAASHAVASLVFLGIVSGILHVSCALTMVIDSYATHFDSACFRLDASVHEWNLLQAVLRKVSGAAERGFMAVQSTAVALVTGVILAARGQLSGEPVGAGDVAWLSSTALLVVGAMFIFFKAAEVSERCVRMPSVINSLNFGECVDSRRHYLVEFMSYSAAGFYVWEVRLTSAIALKLTYFCCILAFAGLSQLYTEDF